MAPVEMRDLQVLGFHWHSNTKCEVDSAAKERSGPEVIDIALNVWLRAFLSVFLLRYLKELSSGRMVERQSFVDGLVLDDRNRTVFQ